MDQSRHCGCERPWQRGQGPSLRLQRPKRVKNTMRWIQEGADCMDVTPTEKCLGLTLAKLSLEVGLRSENV